MQYEIDRQMGLETAVMHILGYDKRACSKIPALSCIFKL